jgi:peptidoglycan/LPS O-acetylase OafA/YrhL
VEHVHVEPPEALTEGPERGSTVPDRFGRRLEFGAVLILALTTLATAWCGYEEGTEAKSNSDRYILATVFMAAVLFFAGISLRLEWRPLRIAVLGMACVALVAGNVFVLTEFDAGP